MIWYKGVVIDTCVWIDIANNKEDKFLKVLESLVAKKFLTLIIPEQVKIEWNRNKESRIVSEKRKLIDSILIKINELKSICNVNNNTELIKQLKALEVVLNDDTPIIVADYKSYTERIDRLLNHRNSIHLTDSDNVKNRAVDFALNRRAPFHTKSNSMADALIFLSMLEYSVMKRDSGGYTMFITKNHTDFGDKGTSHLHEHLQEVADQEEVTIEYYNSLRIAVDALQTTSDDWDAVIREWEEEEREREQEAKVRTYIGTCDDCYKENQMGYYLYDSWDIAVMGFCEKCFGKMEARSSRHLV